MTDVMMDVTFETGSKYDEEKLNAMESFGYTLLQKPLECLNIVFPNYKLENYFNEKMVYYNNNIVEVVQNINIEERNTFSLCIFDAYGLVLRKPSFNSGLSKTYYVFLSCGLMDNFDKK